MPDTRWAALALTAVALAGCRQDMHNQPRYKPLQPSRFFADGRSSRPLVEGTVARGHLRADRAYYFGEQGGTAGGNQASGGGQSRSSMAGPGGGSAGGGGTGSGSGSGLGGVGAAQIGGPGGAGGGQLAQVAGGGAAAAGADAFDAKYVKELPYPVTKGMVVRGRERYNIFCSPCHSYSGYGNGMIVQRGLKQPPSFHDQRLRGAPVGHYFDVITNGYGSMYSYAARIPVQDRWAIISYIRALQLSQQGGQGDLPADVLTQVNEKGEVIAGNYRPGNGNLYLGGTPTLGPSLPEKKREVRRTDKEPGVHSEH